MSSPENDPSEMRPSGQQREPMPAPQGVAPVWHTVVLVFGILAISIHGASRLSQFNGAINRLATYGSTAAMEVGLLVWVLFGLRLRKVTLRSLLGGFSFDLRSIAMDIGFAMVFWIASLIVLGTLGVAWSGVEAALTHRPPVTHAPGHPLAPDPEQLKSVRELAELAPANGTEMAAWAGLCVLVGFIEEIVFRGYLQRQFTSWARGSVVAGVSVSALVFGGAHAYQGARSMVLIAVFGVLFSLLALHRRSLRAGMFAHCWHDLMAGLALALLKSTHVI